MKRRGRTRAGLVALAMTATATSAFADAPKDPRFDEANKKYVTGDYAGAAKLYEEAFNRERSRDIAGNWGFAEVHLQHWVRAAELLDFAINGTTESDEHRAKLLARYKEAQSHVVTVRLHAAVPGCVFTSPNKPKLEEAKDFYLEPKTDVTIVAKCGGAYEEMSTSFRGEADQFIETTVQPVGKSKKWKYAAIVGAELGVGVIAGVVFTVLSNNKASAAATDSANVLHDNAGASPCAPSPQPAGCAELKSAEDGRVAFRNLAIGSFAVGGAAAAATIVYLLVKKPKAATSETTGLFIAPHRNGAGLGWRF